MFTLQQNVNSIETEHGFVVTTHYYVTEEKRILIHTKKIKKRSKGVNVDFSDTVGGGGRGGGGVRIYTWYPISSLRCKAME